MQISQDKLFSFRTSVAPYLSSTVDDFAEERRFLDDSIFPHIQSLFEERQSSFTPISVKWTTENEQASSGHGLGVVLEYIRLNRFFISLIGARYGPHNNTEHLSLSKTTDFTLKSDWCNRNFTIAAARGYQWVLENGNPSKSFQEIEIQQAAFHGSPDHCYFYFRQPEYLDDKLKDADEEETRKLSEIYLPVTSEENFNVRELKKMIVNKGLRVKYYSTLNDLGKQMVEDWQYFLQYEMPLLPRDPSTATEEYTSWVANESFANHRRKHFIRSTAITNTISEISRFCTKCLETHRNPTATIQTSTDYRNYSIRRYIRPPPLPVTSQSILLLEGESGCGKSSLICNWISEFTANFPDVRLQYIYVASSQHNRDLMNFLWAAVKNLRQYKCLKDDKDPPHFFAENRPTNYEDMCHMFTSSLRYGPCIFVIDGLNHMRSDTFELSSQLKSLSWLPYPLPGNCIFIVSTSLTDVAYKTLANRGDTLIVRCPTFDDSNFINDYLTEYINKAGYLLTPKVFQKLQEFKINRKPLFLTLMANEMTSYNVNRNLIRYLNARRELSSIHQFFTNMLKRWTQDFGWTNPSHRCVEVVVPELRGWVADAVLLIALSRNGMKMSEILHTLRIMGYTKRAEVHNFDWLRLRGCLGHVVQETPDGLLVFSDITLKDNMEYILLKTITSVNTTPLPGSGCQSNSIKERYHQLLATYFFACKDVMRQASELPYHLAMARNYSELKTAITDQKIFLKLEGDENWPHFRYDLDFYCKLLRNADVDVSYEFCDKLHTVGVVSSPCNTLMDSPHHTSWDRIDSTMFSISELPADYSAVEEKMHEMLQAGRMAHYVANMLMRQNEPETAGWLSVEVYTFLHAIYPLPKEDLLMYCDVQKRVGDFSAKKGQVNEARIWYKKALDVVCDIIDMNDDSMSASVQDIHGDILRCYGDIFAQNQELAEAEQCFNEARICWENCQNVPKIASICLKIGDIRKAFNDHRGNESYLLQALQITRDWYGPKSSPASHCLYTLGCSLQNSTSRDRTKAEEYFREALSIAEASSTLDRLHIANLLTRLGKILRDESGKNERREALMMFKRALDIKNLLLGSEHAESRELMDCYHQLHVNISYNQPKMWETKYRDTVRPQSASFFREVCRRHCSKSHASRSSSEQSNPVQHRQRRPLSAISHCTHLSATDKILLQSYIPDRDLTIGADSRMTTPTGGGNRRSVDYEERTFLTDNFTVVDKPGEGSKLSTIKLPSCKASTPDPPSTQQQPVSPSNRILNSPRDSPSRNHRTGSRYYGSHSLCTTPLRSPTAPLSIHGPYSKIISLMSEGNKKVHQGKKTLDSPNCAVKINRWYPESTLKKIVLSNIISERLQSDYLTIRH